MKLKKEKSKKPIAEQFPEPIIPERDIKNVKKVAELNAIKTRIKRGG